MVVVSTVVVPQSNGPKAWNGKQKPLLIVDTSCT